MHLSANRVFTKDREAEVEEKNSEVGRIPPSTSPLDSRLKIPHPTLRPAPQALKSTPLSARRGCVSQLGRIKDRGGATALLAPRSVPAVAAFHESFQLRLCPTRALHALRGNAAPAGYSRQRLEHRSALAERGESRRGRPESRARSPRDMPETAHDPRTVRRRLQHRDLHGDKAAGAEEEGVPEAHGAHPAPGLRQALFGSSLIPATRAAAYGLNGKSQRRVPISPRNLAPAFLLGAQNVVDDVGHVIEADSSPQLAEQQTGNRDFVTPWGGNRAREIQNERKNIARRRHLQRSRPRVLARCPGRL